jgi:hypothetical protein
MGRAGGVLLLTVYSLTGCVSVNPAARKVRITRNPEVVRGCEFLGNVRALGGSLLHPGNQETMENKVVNEAAKMGGNVVLMSTMLGPYESSSSGEVYRCPPPSTTPAP